MQATKTMLPDPPLEWAKFKGNYESDVKLYFHGNSTMSALRYMFKVYDNNMFATAWITSCLVEAYRYGNAPKPTEDQITMSVDAIMDHRNKNLKYENSIMAFWPQILDEEFKVYQSTPVNLLAMFNLTQTTNWTVVYELFDKIGLHDVTEIMKHLLATREGYQHVFKIPPDFDDTSVNLGLGSLLRDNVMHFPYASAAWEGQNSNLSSVFNAMKHYAYRPLSGDRRVNTIDTRTYFYMRKFLEKAASEKKDVSLVTTWVQDLVDVKTQYFQGIDTPGNVNNVDITVCANALFGITNAILSGLVTSEVLYDPVLQQLYLNTSTMIEFQIQTNFSGRPDLALTYYPSVFEFYWFVARTYTQLERKARIGELPHEAMRTVMEGLGSALKGNMTQHVISQSKMEGSDMIYYDDFLGDGDIDNNKKPVEFGEDRLWTTSMAINALITTWTVYNDATQKLNWYDANRDEYFNGTKIPGDEHHHGPTIRGMEGVATEDWYKQQLMIPHSDRLTPLDFHGFNDQDTYFPFWNSEPYTYTFWSQFPANRDEYFNGTKVAKDGKYHGGETIRGMEGVMSEDWYQQQIKLDHAPTSWSSYPANRDEYFNGTKVPHDGKRHYGEIIRGMEGVMEEDWYQQQIKLDHAPVDFHGYNKQSDFFPFWNSEPYTYVTSLLALSTFTNIE
ncbi:unnamed protein product [Mytilus edulis]|uniref:Uncharacterized protein n=1 Tax=Mytilus edulis TaxID=6550 RepID=A0A8S3V4C3_MYTED|nr:unnamed protein product [Mytilus edulis]